MVEPVVTLDDLRQHLALTADQDADDLLIQGKLDAAQDLIERHLGYGLLERFETVHAVPPAIREAILQLAAWWYENREAVTDRGAPLPFGVSDIIASYREWSF
ncbi:head-tail connector protein [Paracoccus sp. NSM]|uniref:head-tail connector protein n=1 Tax=Paracoccus sp. NSM TaxID=3457784 RepID=UPI004035F703